MLTRSFFEMSFRSIWLKKDYLLQRKKLVARHVTHQLHRGVSACAEFFLVQVHRHQLVEVHFVVRLRQRLVVCSAQGFHYYTVKEFEFEIKV